MKIDIVLVHERIDAFDDDSLVNIEQKERLSTDVLYRYETILREHSELFKDSCEQRFRRMPNPPWIRPCTILLGLLLSL